MCCIAFIGMDSQTVRGHKIDEFLALLNTNLAPRTLDNDPKVILIFRTIFVHVHFNLSPQIFN